MSILSGYIESTGKGNIEYEKPVLIFSENEIKFSIEKNDAKMVTINIKSENDKNIIGLIAINGFGVTCENKEFSGNNVDVDFCFNSRGIDVDDVIKGEINVLSNGGEYVIPYEVTVEKKRTEVLELSITGCNDLYDIYLDNQEEALCIFKSDKFKDLIADEKEAALVYDSLWGVNLAVWDLEEFFVALGVKDRVDFTLGESGKSIIGVEQDKEEFLTIKKEGQGYIGFEIEVVGDFISVDKNLVTDRDFEGDTYSLKYTIKKDLLHKGNNTGSIKVKTPIKTLKYDVNVHKESRELNVRREYLDCKKKIISLYKLYYEFRLRKMPTSIWAKESVGYVSGILSIEPDNDMFWLVKAMFLIIRKQIQEAKWILEKYERKLDELREQPEVYGYYLYITTLIDKEPVLVRKIRAEIESLYQKNDSSWILLWLLFYIDEKYENNNVLKYHAIENIIKKGCTSPIIYIEACNIFLNDPLVLSKLENIEIRILQFMYMQNCISENLSIQIMALVSQKRDFDGKIFRVCELCCHKYPSIENISIICRYLIRNDKSGDEYLQWYEKGIGDDLKITRLYEYYLMSVNDEYSLPMPKTVYLYFRYNSNINNKKKAFLYANIIKNKEYYPEIYKNFEKTIRDFMADQLYKGIINLDMAVIYREFMNSSFITKDNIFSFINVLDAFYLECDNSSIRKVTVAYDKLKVKRSYSVFNGKAYIQLFSKDYRLIFEDADGNRMLEGITYTVEKLIESEKYLERALKYAPSASELLINFLEKEESLAISEEEKIILIYNVIMSYDVRDTYKSNLRERILDFYYNTDNNQHFEIYMMNMLVEFLNTRERIKYIEIMVSRGFYKKAYDVVKSYGFASVPVVSLIKMCKNIMLANEYEYNEEMISICHYIFQQGKYNAAILKYLSMHYMGRYEEMCKLYKADKDFEVPTLPLLEKICELIILENIKDDNVDNLFLEYIEAGVSSKMKSAFLAKRCFDYFIYGEEVSGDIFKIIIRDYTAENPISDICKIGLLKFWSEKEYLSDLEGAAVEELLAELSMKNLRFEFYKKFNSDILAKFAWASSMIIEHVTSPKHRVEISYSCNGNETEREEMKIMYGNIFSKSVPMFYGDRLSYTITEENKDGSRVVKKEEVVMDEVPAINNLSRYNLLNRAVYENANDNKDSLLNLMNEYQIKKHIADNMFKMI